MLKVKITCNNQWGTTLLVTVWNLIGTKKYCISWPLLFLITSDWSITMSRGWTNDGAYQNYWTWKHGLLLQIKYWTSGLIKPVMYKPVSQNSVGVKVKTQNLHPLIARKSQCLTISIEPIGPRSFLQQNKMLSLTVNLSIEFCNL